MPNKKLLLKGETPDGGSRGGTPFTSLDSTVTNNRFIIQKGKFTVPVNYSNVKVVKTGKHIEIHIPELPYILDRPPTSSAKAPREKQDRGKEYRHRTAKRAMDAIRRLAKGNFNPKYTKHIVLTFADTYDFDISDIYVCNSKFSIFAQKLRDLDKDYMYIKVPEYHKDRNAVHFHVMCDIKYIEQDFLQNLWGLGIVHIKMAPVDIAKYLYKYLLKNADDARYIGKRTWSHSKNMFSTRTLYGKAAMREIVKVQQLGIKPEYKFNYSSDYNGNIVVEEFNSAQFPSPNNI